MQISTSYNSINSVDFSPAITELASIKRADIVNSNNDFKSFEKFVTQNQKNEMVTGADVNGSNIIIYNFNLEPGTPISKIIEAGKSFNDTYLNFSLHNQYILNKLIH